MRRRGVGPRGRNTCLFITYTMYLQLQKTRNVLISFSPAIASRTKSRCTNRHSSCGTWFAKFTKFFLNCVWCSTSSASLYPWNIIDVISRIFPIWNNKLIILLFYLQQLEFIIQYHNNNFNFYLSIYYYE